MLTFFTWGQNDLFIGACKKKNKKACFNEIVVFGDKTLVKIEDLQAQGSSEMLKNKILHAIVT